MTSPISEVTAIFSAIEKVVSLSPLVPIKPIVQMHHFLKNQSVETLSIVKTHLFMVLGCIPG